MGTGLGGEGVVGVVGENSYSNAESSPLVTLITHMLICLSPILFIIIFL